MKLGTQTTGWRHTLHTMVMVLHTMVMVLRQVMVLHTMVKAAPFSALVKANLM
jgi:hypothetical protein